jgi:predicted type IV restriction endonuclease
LTGIPLNEQAVREEIIAPLLKALDYRADGDNDIRYEVWLQHRRASLGHKKPTDPPIRGKADYVCSAGRRVSWIIEAKALGAVLTS